MNVTDELLSVIPPAEKLCSVQLLSVQLLAFVYAIVVWPPLITKPSNVT